jgi:hypothetical protein
MSLEWVSAAEAPRFVELITNYVSDIKSIGPLGQGEGEGGGDVVQGHLKAAVKAASTQKVRIALGRLAKDMHKTNDYSPQVITAGVSKKVLPSFRQERITQEIQLCLSEHGPCDIDDLCKEDLFNFSASLIRQVPWIFRWQA